MADGYAKLFSDIVDSSIWEEPPETCKVWVTLLALCNADGYIRGSIGWLAGKSKVSVEQCQTAIQKFLLPDPRSRTPDFEGRRIEQLEDGWLVLNYISFRDRLSSNPQAVATRLRVQKHRSRYKALRNVTSGDPASASAFGNKEEGCGEKHFPEVESPSWEEFWSYCQLIGLAAEWYAKDKFLAAAQKHWRQHSNWRAYAQRSRNWWEDDGRPMDRRSRNGKTSGVFPEQRLKVLDDLIARHPCNPQSLVHSTTKQTTELKSEYANLREERQKLRNDIASAPTK